MSKIVMRLHLPEPKVRKRAVRAVQKHKDKTKYTRKCTRKALLLQSPGANAIATNPMTLGANDDSPLAMLPVKLSRATDCTAVRIPL